jgi:hypothetical protein
MVPMSLNIHIVYGNEKKKKSANSKLNTDTCKPKLILEVADHN